MSKFREMLKNEYIRSAVFLIMIIIIIAAFWFGLRIGLRTDYPLLAVASGSMVPTLNVGDLIIVQGGLGGNDIVAEYETGDVIVFHKPGDFEELIVHRAVAKEFTGEEWEITTKGDHNPSPDWWRVLEGDIVGKVVLIVPYVGNVPLFVHTQQGMFIIVILIVILILLEFTIPSAKKRMKPDQPEEEETRLFDCRLGLFAAQVSHEDRAWALILHPL